LQFHGFKSTAARLQDEIDGAVANHQPVQGSKQIGIPADLVSPFDPARHLIHQAETERSYNQGKPQMC
jgi:hypothetical protein